MTAEPTSDNKKKTDEGKSKKIVECEKCNIDCRFKGKSSLPRLEDLLSVSEECFYRKELKQLGESLSAILEKNREAINRAAQSLANVNVTPVALSYQSQIRALAEFSKHYQEQMMAVAQSYSRLFLNPQFERAATLQYQTIQPALQMLRDTARAASITTPYYYNKSEAQVLERPVKIPVKSVSKKFIDRLKACPKGKEGWVEYQNICKDILTYLFIPPLMGPFEQSPTENASQIRDLIFDIPYSINGFWGYIRDKFDASGIIVECKNYESPIGAKEFVVTSKYFGQKRLGRFGIILSREPTDSYHAEMKRLWNSETNVLILPLTDEHLIRMLDLKERNNDPQMVIDMSVHKFLRDLE